MFDYIMGAQYYSPPQPPSKSNRARNIVIIVLAIVVVILALAVIGSLASRGGSSQNGGGSTPQYTPQQYTVNIVNGLITVPAGGYESYEFTVPACASYGTVSGSFTASGGSGNDIRVYIMNQTSFINWENGHTVPVYYSSGQLTTATIRATLPGGTTYYLVYDNTFSVFSSKNVQTTVNLYYSC